MRLLPRYDKKICDAIYQIVLAKVEKEKRRRKR